MDDGWRDEFMDGGWMEEGKEGGREGGYVDGRWVDA